MTKPNVARSMSIIEYNEHTQQYEVSSPPTTCCPSVVYHACETWEEANAKQCEIMERQGVPGCVAWSAQSAREAQAA